MTLTALEVAALSKRLSCWEYAEYFFAALVAVACAGEYIAEFTNWLTRGIRESARRQEAKDKWLKRSTLLLVVALAFELVCLVRTNSLSGQLIGSLSDKAENADQKAQSAIDKYGIAETKADALTERLKTASHLLDTLDQRVLVLGPRWQLLEDHKAEFIGAMKSFAGHKITLVSCGMTGGESLEADRLRDDLDNFLGEFDEGKKDGAGWLVERVDAKWGECLAAWRNYGTLTRGDGGLALVMSDTADLAAKRPAMDSANALVGTLTKLGITTRITSSGRVDNAAIVAEPNSFWKRVEDDPKAVFLLVGPNPQFTLTNAEKRLNGKAGE